MWAALSQAFKAMFVLFEAAEHTAQAVNHLAITAEQSAAAFSDEASIKREKAKLVLLANLTDKVG